MTGEILKKRRSRMPHINKLPQKNPPERCHINRQVTRIAIGDHLSLPSSSTLNLVAIWLFNGIYSGKFVFWNISPPLPPKTPPSCHSFERAEFDRPMTQPKKNPSSLKKYTSTVHITLQSPGLRNSTHHT